ncbi:MAG: hypothetical protein GW947_02225 [Candidatus Pacebacteria bacterium]|nr:hypothetical protein [Candidatus Paceibacterota bacterium]
MKNIDPKSGLKQIVTGKLYLPRRAILELIRSRRITPTQLGYFVIALISADWNQGEYRYGLIRHDIRRLAAIWNVPYSTLSDNFKKLQISGQLTTKNKLLSIVDFNDFQTFRGQYANKNCISDEVRDQIFGKSFLQSEISDSNSITEPKSLKIPFKVEFNKTPPGPLPSRLERTIEDYQRIYAEGPYTTFGTDEMMYLDQHMDAEGKYIP